MSLSNFLTLSHTSRSRSKSTLKLKRVLFSPSVSASGRRRGISTSKSASVTPSTNAYPYGRSTVSASARRMIHATHPHNNTNGADTRDATLKASTSTSNHNNSPSTPGTISTPSQTSLTTSSTSTTPGSSANTPPPTRPAPTRPRLPIPPLESTLRKYVQSLKPFIEEDARKGVERRFGRRGLPRLPANADANFGQHASTSEEGNVSVQERERRVQARVEEEMGIREGWVRNLLGDEGLGRKMQERLIALDAHSPHNWLDDNFWLRSYHAWRAPLLVNSDWWLVFQDAQDFPDAQPGKARSGSVVENGFGMDAARLGPFTSYQITRAARLARRTLEFKDMVERGEVHPDTTRMGLWFRESIEKMFNIARIPRMECDELSSPPPHSPALSAPTEEPVYDPLWYNVIVLAKNRLYALRAYEFDLSSHNDNSSSSSLSSKPNPPRPKLISHAQFRSRLEGIAMHAAAACSAEKGGEQDRADVVQLGVLSADGRDEWSKNLTTLLSISPENKHAYDALVKSLMCICLDDEVYAGDDVKLDPIEGDLSRSPSPSQSTLSQTKSGLPSFSSLSTRSHLLSLRSTPHNLSNRFFDKPYSLIVDPAGRAGAVGEHSPCDALVPSIVAEWSVVGECDVEYGQKSSSDEIEVDEASASAASEKFGEQAQETEGWRILPMHSSPALSVATRAARGRAETIISDSDDDLLWWGEYGGDWIKGVSGLSPDAYVQLAMQLAFYITHQAIHTPQPRSHLPDAGNRIDDSDNAGGPFTATYETALTRAFHHGRTETIRAHTAEARRWVLGMVEMFGLDSAMSSNHFSVSSSNESSRPSNESYIEIFHLLRRAARAHTTLTRDAMAGRGIDRHLLGLGEMLKEIRAEAFHNASTLETSIPEDAAGIDPGKDGSALFTDPLFSRSQEWRLSTSGLSAGHWFKGTGFGAGYQDGYGINYLTAPNLIKFGVESKFSSPHTSTAQFKKGIVLALKVMREAVECALQEEHIEGTGDNNKAGSVQSRL